MADETKKSAKDRVKEKFDIAADMKESKIQTSIRITQEDGKIMANFSISGLPVNKSKSGALTESSSSYRDFSKTFDDFDSFATYAKKFLETSDEDLIKMAKE